MVLCLVNSGTLLLLVLLEKHLLAITILCTVQSQSAYEGIRRVSEYLTYNIYSPNYYIIALKISTEVYTTATL